MNYRWEQCYEIGDDVHWAIVDDESAAKGCVTSHLLVVNHEWATYLERPFPECELPQRIIALLNGDTTYFHSSIYAMRHYDDPANGKPYSEEGLRDLQRQCMDAAREGDSSLLEMAGLAIKRLLDDRKEQFDELEFAEGALVDTYASEEGCDLVAARRIAESISGLLVSHGRTSIIHEAGKDPDGC